MGNSDLKHFDLWLAARAFAWPVRLAPYINAKWSHTGVK